VREPIAVYSRSLSGGSGTLRISMKQHIHGEARNAMLAIFGAMRQIKTIFVYDEDINIRNDRECEWAMGTRFQADKDIITINGMMGMPMDPSLEGRRTGAKVGFDCTRPFGRGHEIIHMRCAAKNFTGPARFQTVEQALESGPLFYSHVVEAVGSSDGREVAAEIDRLREQGRIGRDKDGRYALVTDGTKGYTAQVGEWYHDPNHGI
jgi:2,5-furandicarboxylate decarboxylase 1